MRGHRRRMLFAVLVVCAMAISACGGTDAAKSSSDKARAANRFPEWPAPDKPLERTEEAGLVPAVKEHLQTHRHAHLDVFVDGKPVMVPAGIGIDITDPGVKHFPDPAYGGIDECS